MNDVLPLGEMLSDEPPIDCDFGVLSLDDDIETEPSSASGGDEWQKVIVWLILLGAVLLHVKDEGKGGPRRGDERGRSHEQTNRDIRVRENGS